MRSWIALNQWLLLFFKVKLSSLKFLIIRLKKGGFIYKRIIQLIWSMRFLFIKKEVEGIRGEKRQITLVQFIRQLNWFKTTFKCWQLVIIQLRGKRVWVKLSRNWIWVCLVLKVIREGSKELKWGIYLITKCRICLMRRGVKGYLFKSWWQIVKFLVSLLK